MGEATATSFRPESLAELRDAMLDAARADHRLLVSGAGTAADWGGRPGAVDATVDTTGMDGLISYNPTDMTVAVQAGMPLHRLQDVLAENGQWVALDPARAASGATVGGIVATADAGPSRHTFGTSRDCVIGVTVVLADGVVARSGGHVIKNVAGYDLAKLFHGSLGTLGVVAEVVLRLHPRPGASGTLAVACPAGDAFALGGRMIEAALEPTALEWCDGTLLARFDGTPRGVDERGRQATAIAGETSSWLLDDAAEVAQGGDGDQWQQVADVVRGQAGDTVVRLGTRPDLFGWAADRLAELAAEHGLAAAMTSSMYAGVHTVQLHGGTPGAHAALVETLRREVSASGGATTVCRWADGLRAELPAWGEHPPALAVLRAVKRVFDPDDRLCPGRFAPWF